MKLFKFIITILLLMGVMPCGQTNKLLDSNTITIGFAGDVMLGRLVNDKISRQGYDYPFGNMIQFLKKNDLNIVNLETTLTTSKNKVSKVFNFKADPEKVQSLKNAHIGVVNLANNHILDFSKEGLFETLTTLKQAGISYVGAGHNILQAKEPTIVNIKNIRIGIMGYTDNEPGWIATDDRPGTNYIQIGNIGQIKKDIENIRSKVDLLIISLHWGPNMRETPSKNFRDFAHALVDVGVDIIHGHSAHVVQGIEIYKNKLILYDTGDFVDDYMVGPNLRNDHTFLFNVTVKKDQIKYLSLIPALITDMQVNVATGEDRDKMIARIKKLSGSFSTVFKENDNQLIVAF
jgi:poly-gamma-glutamate capsule biosynthesis protein CapA/YwtB (metallophosphatase superfamily)